MQLAVRDIVGEFAITLEDGQKVFDRIAPALTRGEAVELDFDGVAVFASPFFNAAIGQLLKDHKPEDLNRLLRMERMTPAGMEVVQQVVKNAKEYYAYPDYREAQRKVLQAMAEEGVMPPNYIVRAQVVDIRTDTPKPADAFLVDTNVWFWVAYPRASLAPRPPQLSQISAYPLYLAKALTAKARVYGCGLSLAELTHQIEKTEREIYNATHGTGSVGTKDYRHNFPAERAKVVSAINAAWTTVKGISSPMSVNIDDPTTDAALVRFQNQLLDGYDLFLLEAAAQARITQILTDDGDYCTVPGIQLFTANSNVVTAATAQGMLLVR